jgi:hypothetical protein
MPDDGNMRSFAHMVVEIPAGAKGLYTIPLLTDETFLASSTAPPVELESLAEVGFEVNILTGSCCSNLSVQPAACEDGVLQSECGDDEIPPSLWSAGKTCAQGCVECVTDAGCNDNDSCTTERCNAIGLCDRGIVGNWDPTTDCCEGSGPSPVITSLDDGDACTTGKCVDSSPNANPASQETGTAQHNFNTDSCDDGNPCTVGDVCSGTASEANGGCQGSDVNAIACLSAADCPLDPLGVPYACTEGFCFCTLTPNVRFVLSGPSKTCVGGFTPGAPCGADADCPGGGTCGQHAGGANCYDEGEKITALVHMGSAGSPINGGQFLITYDASCVKLNSIDAVAPYSTVYGPTPGNKQDSVFIAVGVDPFAGINGPLGNTDILSLSLTKIGDCSKCDLCFASNNPQNTYLVDDDGQIVEIEGKCKEVNGDGELVLDVPGNIKSNVDCDKPTALITWDAPSASFSCGDANLTCRGAHESGQNLNFQAMGGGTMQQGASSFCCYATAKDKCEGAVGCPGAANDCAVGGDGKPVGCWTVQVNDETSLDIDVQFEPPITHNDPGGVLTRCITFCLWTDCSTAPLCFEEDVDFGGPFNFTGKTQSKVKIPGKGQFDCMSAQDQKHTLRSCCDTLSGCMYCDGGQLVASFEGDPELGGNWLIGGNIDGWKKESHPDGISLNVIDIVDFGEFVSEYGTVYADNDTPCPPHDAANADINGDGFAGIGDYLFILRNFLVSAKDCCCDGQTGAGPSAPTAEISVAELRRLGMGDLAQADLNGDGLVNSEDMDAFMQGARPSKENNDRGGKGLRSGR